MICNISGVYEKMYPVETKVNMTDISGTNCYCDEEAARMIRECIFSTDEPILSDIRLLDSGNFHYLSYFFMEKIREPFALIIIDNHTDMQQPGFGRILSCGGWVRYAMEELGNLKQVCLVGMSEEHLSEAMPLPDDVSYIKSGSLAEISCEFPIYLSIDKDVLAVEYAATDWDQGQMGVDELVDIVTQILHHHRVLGVDICGEKKDGATEAQLTKNRAVNDRLLEAIFSLQEGGVV